jgi:6-phosphogluconolactonase
LLWSFHPHASNRHEEIAMLKTVVPLLAAALALGAGSHVAIGQEPDAEASRGAARPARWALAANVVTNTAIVYAVDDGVLTRHSAVAAGAFPRSIAAHPSGRFAYVGGSGAIQAFRFDRSGGTLTLRATVTLPGAELDVVAVEPLGRFLYATDRLAGTVLGFWIHPLSGVPTPLPGFPVAAPAPGDIVFDRGGRHAFVVNVLANTVSAYRVGLTGRLTPVEGSPFPTPVGRPRSLALDPEGRLLYVTHVDGGAVSAFHVDRRGALTPVAGSPFPVGADPAGVASSVDGRTLYVSDPLLEIVLMQRIDSATGALSPLTPPRVAAGNNVDDVRPDPSGRFLYVAAFSPGAIFSYAIDAEGMLTPVPGSPLLDEDGITSLALVR